MKYQAIRNGQKIGKPKNDRPAAQQIADDDMSYTKSLYDRGLITKEELTANRWNVIKVRG